MKYFHMYNTIIGLLSVEISDQGMAKKFTILKKITAKMSVTRLIRQKKDVQSLSNQNEPIKSCAKQTYIYISK